MKARTAWRWGALAAVAIVIVALAMRSRSQAVAVETARAGRGTVEDRVSNSESGTVRARRTARLAAERAGRVVAIPLEEGSAVRAGALLVRLDDADGRLRLETARRDSLAIHAAHESAHAAATLARSQWERMRELHQRSLASDAERDQALARFEAAGAELRAAEARLLGAASAVRIAREEIRHLEVRAPFAGAVTRHFVELGESVQPGQAVIEIASLESLYVSAPLDERDAGRVRTGLPARLTVDAYPGVSWDARVTRVAPVVETAREQNRTLEIEADFPRVAGRPEPRPGMTADVEVVLETRPGALRIPTQAVLENDRVLVAVRGRAVSRTLVPGLKNWTWTEVRGGVAEGDRVIVSVDRPGLKAGVRVREDSVRTTAAGGAAADEVRP